MSGLGSAPVKSQHSQLLLNRKFKTFNALWCNGCASGVEQCLHRFFAQVLANLMISFCFGERLGRRVNSAGLAEATNSSSAAEFMTRVREVVSLDILWPNQL